MACTDSMEMVSLLSELEYVCGMRLRPSASPFLFPGRYVRERRKPKAADVGPTPLLRQFSHLRLVDDVLYREVIIGPLDRSRVRKSMQTSSSGNCVEMLTNGAL
jgi:hypothetical protein